MHLRFFGCLAFLACALTACNSSEITMSKADELPYLSKRIFLPDPNDTIIDLMPLRKEMAAYAETIPEPFGLHFEYLPSGSSIGINDRASFIEASLLKVPVTIKLYQLKNEGLLSLNDVVRLEEEDMDPTFGALWQRGVGAELTVRELVHLMLQDSDNTALQMLGRKMASVRPGFVNEIFDNLDIPKESGEHGVVISAKSYTSILRSLYLSAALPKKDANEILGILTETSFSDMLPAGLPADVPVAHKVGIYQKENFFTYGDCGIVFIPRRPYSLCIFVHGSQEHAKRYMKDFSRMAYEFISRAESRTYEEN